MTSMSSNQHPKPSIYSNTCMIHICTGSPSFACLFFVHEFEKSKEAGTPGTILPPGHILLKRIFLFDECHQYDVPHAMLSAVLDTFSTTFAIPTTTTLAIPTISQGLYYHLPWTAVSSPSAEFPLPTSAYWMYETFPSPWHAVICRKWGGWRRVPRTCRRPMGMGHISVTHTGDQVTYHTKIPIPLSSEIRSVWLAE